MLEALADDRLTVDKVLVADNAFGPQIAELMQAAERRGVEVRRVSPMQVTKVSRNGRQDQGVVADVVAPGLRRLDASNASTLAGPVLVLDGITNPQNVGMILRTAVAAGVAGIVMPRAGVPDLGPLVVKASAGVAFEAPVLRADDAASAVALLRDAGFRVFGLVASSDRSLWDARPFPERSAFVLGGETGGLTVAVDEPLAIPMAGTVDSLNVAVAAGVLCFELLRRSLA
ncbi:MAG: rRNA (guanosine2251-2-O)-methyltransferase [Actinomycetota bacterium]|nr:rRNA (guanosine2251-2-O)-methyltransferase [Actinomycetota bacterium]